MNADLVVRDEEGKAMTVRYDAVNVMLLNEVFERTQPSAAVEGDRRAATEADCGSTSERCTAAAADRSAHRYRARSQ